MQGLPAAVTAAFILVFGGLSPALRIWAQMHRGQLAIVVLCRINDHNDSKQDRNKTKQRFICSLNSQAPGKITDRASPGGTE